MSERNIESKLLIIKNTGKESGQKEHPLLEGVDDSLAALAWENHLKRLGNGYPPEKAHLDLLDELESRRYKGPSTNPNLPIENDPKEDLANLNKYLFSPEVQTMTEQAKLLEAKEKCEEAFRDAYTLVRAIRYFTERNRHEEALLAQDRKLKQALDGDASLEDKLSACENFKKAAKKIKNSAREILDIESYN